MLSGNYTRLGMENTLFQMLRKNSLEEVLVVQPMLYLSLTPKLLWPMQETRALSYQDRVKLSLYHSIINLRVRKNKRAYVKLEAQYLWVGSMVVSI